MSEKVVLIEKLAKSFGELQVLKGIDLAVDQEDVDVLMLSIHSGAHNHIFPRVMEDLKARGLSNLVVLAGGIIPEASSSFCLPKDEHEDGTLFALRPDYNSRRYEIRYVQYF